MDGLTGHARLDVSGLIAQFSEANKPLCNGTAALDSIACNCPGSRITTTPWFKAWWYMRLAGGQNRAICPWLIQMLVFHLIAQSSSANGLVG